MKKIEFLCQKDVRHLLFTKIENSNVFEFSAASPSKDVGHLFGRGNSLFLIQRAPKAFFSNGKKYLTIFMLPYKLAYFKVKILVEKVGLI
jgi:hypothetical protein